MQKLKSNRDKLQAYLQALRPMGGTNLYDGLELALLMEDVDTIFVLSDGAPGAGKYTTTKDILAAVERLNQTRRVLIHSIAVGMNSELLRKLAQENGGQYVQR